MPRRIPLAKKKAPRSQSALVDEYVESLNGWQQDVAKRLRRLIRSASKDLIEEVKWGWPCYTCGGKNVCGFMHMRETVNFVLYRGAELDDPASLVEGTGKAMRHVKLRGPADIHKKPFTAFIKQSISLIKSE